MADIQDPKLLYLKGTLFLCLGTLASAMIVWEQPSLKVVVLLAISIWAFARAYYFAFYVIEHYVEPGWRFSGLWSFARYLCARRAREKVEKK